MNYPNMVDARKRGKEEVKYIYENRNYNEIFKGKKYFIKTYGCQMNVHDSEEIKKILENLGYTEIEDYEQADLIILNTCAIRENAHDKVFGFLGRCKHLKKTNKDLILGLCGCMAQEENVVKEIREKHKYIDIVFGTHNMNELPDMLMNFYGKQSINVYSKEGDVIEFGNLYKRDSKITAWVNIMYGCDKFCTYCIVPYTRGKQRSRKSEDILKEVKELKEQGYKEITLLGQNVNAYGKDLDGEIEFSKLLEKVSDIGIERIRFVTSHPWDFTDKMIDVIASRENIMPYIHLPLQSGSNKILKLMGRRYTKEEYLELFNKIRNKIKNASITTDIIVAFPGETEEDFNDTLDVVNTCKYDGAFTFIYSPRENTPAAKMKNDLTEAEKEDRLHRLNELVNKYSKESNERMLNTIQKVLVIGVSEKDSNKVCGYTENMKLVNVTAPMDTIGQIINVKITDAKSFSLDGEIIEN
ncbi:MAG: tRNA (N6-isopentenyl adenosine(37)-C2)-methylthiotransferase MiaB [Tenericutes bacterium]|nr:tRNA (N6-isopentenyl adenosine(37)-C2)-methylthiotransferase MiaB [Mycoplasmatota bacterium]